MPYRDLREFIARLEEENELRRVKVQVDPIFEVGTIIRKVFDCQGPALLFENVKGSNIPLVTGLLGTFKRYALGIESAPDLRSILKEALKAAKEPLVPRVIKEGPCQQNILQGSDVDLNIFPVPFWHSLDADRFVGTLGVVITRDPETGIRNMGIYRQQVQGRNVTGLLATQSIGRILNKYAARGQSMPVATAIGVEPAILAAACIRAPLGVDELAIAGALRGEPVELVRCKSIDLEVPAFSEIILEGEVPPDPTQWKMEGPFGEFTGYYGGPVSVKPTITLKSVTFRDNPIFQGTPPGRPPSEDNTLRTVGHTVGAWLKVSQAKIPGFKELLLTPGACANFVAVISLEKQYYLGNARQAIYAFWALEENAGKWTIVVDDDIDIFDPGQVEWALATRVQPHRDIIISSDREPGIGLDPSIAPLDREYPNVRACRIGIDATKGFKGFEFPPEIRSRVEDLKRVEKRWKEYGID